MVLAGKGYSATRLADVAEVAGLQAPAIYYYFTSREELVAEVMRAGAARAEQHVRQALDRLPPGTTGLDRICVAVEAHLRVLLELSDYATASIRNTGQLPAAIEREQRAAHRAYGALWRQLLTEAERAGQLRPGIDLRAARMLVIGALNWTPQWWDPDRGPLEQVISTAQRMVRHGLGAE